MKSYLAKLFNKTPKTKFEIRRVPAFMEMTASANYLPISNVGACAGIFYEAIPFDDNILMMGYVTLQVVEDRVNRSIKEKKK